MFKCGICHKEKDSEPYELIIRQVKRRNVPLEEKTICLRCAAEVVNAIEELE